MLPTTTGDDVSAASAAPAPASQGRRRASMTARLSRVFGSSSTTQQPQTIPQTTTSAMSSKTTTTLAPSQPGTITSSSVTPTTRLMNMSFALGRGDSILTDGKPTPSGIPVDDDSNDVDTIDIINNTNDDGDDDACDFDSVFRGKSLARAIIAAHSPHTSPPAPRYASMQRTTAPTTRTGTGDVDDLVCVGVFGSPVAAVYPSPASARAAHRAAVSSSNSTARGNSQHQLKNQYHQHHHLLSHHHHHHNHHKDEEIAGPSAADTLDAADSIDIDTIVSASVTASPTTDRSMLQPLRSGSVARSASRHSIASILRRATSSPRPQPDTISSCTCSCISSRTSSTNSVRICDCVDRGDRDGFNEERDGIGRVSTTRRASGAPLLLPRTIGNADGGESDGNDIDSLLSWDPQPFAEIAASIPRKIVDIADLVDDGEYDVAMRRFSCSHAPNSVAGSFASASGVLATGNHDRGDSNDNDRFHSASHDPNHQQQRSFHLPGFLHMSRRRTVNHDTPAQVAPPEVKAAAAARRQRSHTISKMQETGGLSRVHEIAAGNAARAALLNSGSGRRASGSGAATEGGSAANCSSVMMSRYLSFAAVPDRTGSVPVENGDSFLTYGSVAHAAIFLEGDSDLPTHSRDVTAVLHD